jgi:hypothetical protein
MIGSASRLPAVLALVLLASCGGDPPEAWIEVQRLSGSRTELVQARCLTRGLKEPIVYSWKTGSSLRQYTSMPRDGAALLVDVLNPNATSIDCHAGPPGNVVTAWTSLAPVVIRSVTVLDAGKPAPAGTTASVGHGLAVEGTGFGVQPRGEDGIYFARARGRTYVANHSCTGAVWTDTRIVACVPPGVTAGLWQVRVQAGGRLGLLDTRAGAVEIK